MIKSVILLMALSQSPSDTIDFVSPAQIMTQCDELENNGNYQEAVTLYLTVSSSDTSYIEIQSKLMSTYNDLKKHDEAIKIGNAIKDEFSEVRNTIYINLGNAYLAKGDVEKSRFIYNEGLKLFPQSYVLLYNLGITHHRSKEYEKAVESFQKSLKINPYYANNHLMLGYISALQGHITKSFLSYMTYLSINPNNNSALIFLNNLANSGVREEGSIASFSDNTVFEYYDNLIKSEAALDSRFKQNVDFNADLVKQSELLLSKLRYIEHSNNFWMDQYVPLYIDLEKSQLSSAFIYYILKSTNNEEVKKWIDRHDKERSDWIDLINVEFDKTRKSGVTEILDVKGEYSHWFFGNNNLSAIGDKIDDDTRIGPWLFYSQNGQLNATGLYNENGEKIKQWTYYHENGQTSREEHYDDLGNMTKPAMYYHENGALSIVAPFDSEDKINGFLEYYYGCGQIKEKVPYDKGKQAGKGQVFFNTGELKIDYNLRDAKLDGDHITYFKNGQINKRSAQLNDKDHGKYNSYYIGGQPNEIGQYDNDSLSGEWIGYHPNGEMSYKGFFNNGNRINEWTDYYSNGNISERARYNDEGKRNGKTEYFTREGYLYNVEIYKNGTLIDYRFLNIHGDILYEAHDEDGNMAYKSYYATGQLNAEGVLKNGKLNGPIKKYYKNGILNYEGIMIDSEYDGKYVEYYSTGEIYTELGYDNGSLNGYYKMYFKNGSINTEGWYVNDQQEQLWKTYYPDGSLDIERYYISGKLNGSYKTYAPKNLIHQEFIYDMNQVIGLMQYDTTGNIYHEAKYKYGTGKRTLKTISGDTIFSVNSQCGEFISNLYNHYSNGQLEGSHPIKNSLYEGEYLAYDILGNQYSKGQYYNDEKSGLWQWFHSNGKVSTTRNYERGLLEKEVNSYYYNGQIEVSSSYSEGKINGSRKYYDQYGELQLIKFYTKEDGHVAYVNIQSNDTISFNSIGKFKLESYFKNGQLAVVQNYFNGKFDGPTTYYNSDGSIVGKTNFKSADYEGVRTEYYDNNIIYIETPYKNDLKNGTEKEYYKNGKIKRESPYFNDNLNGTEIHYNADGTVKSKTFFWNGYIY